MSTPWGGGVDRLSTPFDLLKSYSLGLASAIRASAVFVPTTTAACAREPIAIKIKLSAVRPCIGRESILPSGR